VAELNRVRSGSGGFERILSNWRKNVVRHRERVRPGNANDRQAALANRRGYRGNGVIEHSRMLNDE